MSSSLAAMSFIAPTVWAQTVLNSKTPPTDAKEIANGATVAENDKPQVAVTGGTISLHLEQIPAQEAFRLIAKQTGVSIMFSTKLIGASSMCH
jgi:type II secretory pathway component HofQ